MVRKLIFFSLFSLSLSLFNANAQVTYTPAVQPTAGTPAKLVVSAGTSPNVVTCTITGNAIPATALTYSCSLGSVAITPYTVPFVLGTAYTLQQNYMGHAITIIANATQSTTINVTATADTSTATGGNF